MHIKSYIFPHKVVKKFLPTLRAQFSSFYMNLCTSNCLFASNNSKNFFFSFSIKVFSHMGKIYSDLERGRGGGIYYFDVKYIPLYLNKNREKNKEMATSLEILSLNRNKGKKNEKPQGHCAAMAFNLFSYFQIPYFPP